MDWIRLAALLFSVVIIRGTEWLCGECGKLHTKQSTCLLKDRQGKLVRQMKMEGPFFVIEPPSFVEFTNDTGFQLQCKARGIPPPEITWSTVDGTRVREFPRLRRMSSNGSLIFLPFRAEDYRQDVHATLYKCFASNLLGTIVSRTSRIRAVVMEVYEVQVYDEFVIAGNTGILRCHIPSFVQDHVDVASWTTNSAEIFRSSSKHDGKYVMMPSGDLQVRNAQKKDEHFVYKCHTVHRLTGERKSSATSGKLIVTEAHNSIPPRITSGLQSLTAIQGETVMFPCISQGYPIPNYSWFKRKDDGSAVELTVDERIQLHSDTLVIQHVFSSDTGNYICIINNTVGSEKIETTLIVRVPLSVTIHPSLHVLTIGESIRLDCVVSGSPISSVLWMKDGLQVSTERATILTTKTLQIDEATQVDKGMYQCVASNNYESVQATSEVTLGDLLPVFLKTFSEKLIHPSSSISLNCVAFGSPVPEVKWHLDGEEQAINDRIVYDNYLDQDGNIVSVMNISQIRVEEGGEYSCTAVNHAGKAYHVARINVYGRPYIRPFRKKSAVAGQDMVVKCPYVGYPIEMIFWEKGGRKLPVDHRQVVFPNGTLLVRNLQQISDRGLYTCRVRSPDGKSATREIEVLILVPPAITPFTFPEEQLHIGMRVRVVCVITQGDSPLNISWLKDGSPITNDPSIMVQRLDGFSSSIVINNVALANNGNYTCVAKNAAGTNFYTAQLKAKVPPKWLVEPRDSEVVIGGRLVIDCLATGFPTPTITWMKAVAEVPGDYKEIFQIHSRLRQLRNGSLVLTNAQMDDRGQYSCTVSNSVGNDLSQVVFIDVKVAPSFEEKYLNLSVRQGEKIEFVCSAKGETPLEFVWHKDMEKLVAQNKYRFQWKTNKTASGEESILLITHVLVKDSGNYHCMAKNPYGSAERTFHLTVLEPPDTLLALKIFKVTSRSVTLTWNSLLEKKNIISYYIAELKPGDVSWEDHTTNITIGSSETSVTFRDLQPDFSYDSRLWAFNSAGQSPPSNIVSFKTTEESPSAPPRKVKVQVIDSTSVKVSWEPPVKEKWNGLLQGYYVGFKPIDSSKPFVFRTVHATEEITDEHSMEIDQLKAYTKYKFVVKAFNQAGTSPRSEEVIAHTSENIPSQSPGNVQCKTLSSQSLRVWWDPVSPSAINGLLQGYKIFYHPVKEWYDSIPGEPEITSSVNIILSSLEKFTNYSIEILAFTRTGEGQRSPKIFCSTKDDVPDAPGDIKAAAVALDSVMVSWKPPPRPNGVIKNYNVYMRAMDHSKEEIVKHTLPASQTHYETKNLKKNHRYEFWVTALTSVGEGESTRVVAKSPTGPIVAAKIMSFGNEIIIPWRTDLSLPCLAVGIPVPIREWRFRNQFVELSSRVRILEEGSLFMENVDKADMGVYSCMVSNGYGKDEITYKVIVLVPPDRPSIQLSAISRHSMTTRWSVNNTHFSTIKDFIIYYKREFGDWEEIHVGPHSESHELVNLECGTRYQIYMEAVNNIGKSLPSEVLSVRTKGTAPNYPDKNKFLRVDSVSATLYLNEWDSGGCPILYFVIQCKKREEVDWKLISNNVQQETEFLIPDMVPGCWYMLRVTAHNNAGSITADYQFATLTAEGGTIAPLNQDEINFPVSLLFSWEVIISSFSMLSFVITLLICAYCRVKKPASSKSITESDRTQYVDRSEVNLSDGSAVKTSNIGNFEYMQRNQEIECSILKQTAIDESDLYIQKALPPSISPYATTEISQTNEIKTYKVIMSEIYPSSWANVKKGTFPRSRKETFQNQHALQIDPYYKDIKDSIPEDVIRKKQVNQKLFYSSPIRLKSSYPSLTVESQVPDILHHGGHSSTSNESSPEMYNRHGNISFYSTYQES